MTANTPDNNQAAPDNQAAPNNQGGPGGIKSKLTDAQRAMLASKSGGGAPEGWQSTGKGHKPTHASGKQAKAMKKVRW